VRLQDAAGIIVAAERLVPGLRTLERGVPAWSIGFGSQPDWPAAAWPLLEHTSAGGEESALESVRGDGTRFIFAYRDRTRFSIDTAARQIWCSWTTTFEDASTYLVGPVLAFALRASGELVLHASAIQLAGGAVAFAGPHAAGKSTTAAACARSGAAVLTDDLLRVSEAAGGWLAHPYGTGLRLWPSSEPLVFGRSVELPRIVPGWEKRTLPAGTDGIAGAEEPVPLRAVFLLDCDAEALRIAPLSPAAALVQLSANAATSPRLSTGSRAAEFGQLSRLVASVPCATLSLPAGPLDGVAAAIDDWFAIHAS
jgi:hypothetical protein